MHFAGTSAIAEHDGELIGFVAAYVPPGRPTTLFIWQVAIADHARGRGIGLRMLKEILRRVHWAGPPYVQATITEENEASWKLFMALARSLNAPHKVTALFDADRHFAGSHPTEHLLTIGPIHPTQLSTLTRRKTYA